MAYVEVAINPNRDKIATKMDTLGENKLLWLLSSSILYLCANNNRNAKVDPYNTLQKKIIKWLDNKLAKIDKAEFQGTHLNLSIFHLNHQSWILSSIETNNAFHGLVTKIFSKNTYKIEHKINRKIPSIEKYMRIWTQFTWDMYKILIDINRNTIFIKT